MHYISSVLVLLLVGFSLTEGSTLAEIFEMFTSETDPDADYNVSELIRSKGFPVERHLVVTDDGFILALHRIPYGRSGTTTSGQNRPAVLMMPSLSSSGSQFVVNFPHQSLGFLLADAGYDVWLGNTRGTKESRQHLFYNSNDTQFWDFTYEEIGTLDMAAFVDYIILKTEQKKIFLIAYSMTTTSSLTFLTLRPEYNDKFRVIMLLGPVAYTSSSLSAMGLITYSQELWFPYTNATTAGEFMRSKTLSSGLKFTCRHPTLAVLCIEIYRLITGEETVQQLNRSRIAVYISQGMSASSSKTMAHYGQNQKKGTFARFDYGFEENMKRYGSPQPPSYQLWKITAPVVLFTSDSDIMSNPRDVSVLKSQLRSLVGTFRIKESERFTHLDFYLGLKTREILYDPLMVIMNHF